MKPLCQHFICNREAEYRCEKCYRRFCSDHGTPGGDRQVQDVGAVAYPSVCFECGGFNVDEGLPIPQILDSSEDFIERC